MTSLTRTELVALLRMQRIPFIGDINAKKLIQRCGNAVQVFKESKKALQKIEGIGPGVLSSFFNDAYLGQAEKELEFIEKNRIQCLSYQEDAYPEGLKHCIDGPILLFSKGTIQLKNRKVLSIVGTRQMTKHGAAFIEEFVGMLAPVNPVIVSGFAYGVDITAQRAAMENQLQTVGCLAHGLNQIYPKVHTKFVPPVERHGGFFTEFWSTSKPDRENFLKRNRIIAGISQATLVVESAEKGGSLVTAELANGYHRDVFAVPGRPTDTFSVGCNRLIKQQKAHLVTSAADLMYLLGWQLPEKEQHTVQKQLFVELSETERSIYQYLQLNGKQLLDTVALECNLPIYQVSASLLNMEMKGVIRPLPGKLFEAV